MDSSKFVEGSGECSSNESGWTSYIVSPIHNDDDDDMDGSIGNQQDHYKDAVDVAEDVDSDDSMASDASSGPSDQIQIYAHTGKKDEGKFVSKKHNQQEEKKYHQEQRKAGKDKPVNRTNSAERSKKM